MPRSTSPPADGPVARELPPDPPDPDGWPDALAALRAELDHIDDAIHDLLMQRAEVVARVGVTPGKANGRVALRPGREASIIRRLLARHRGRLPPQSLVRLWRELFAATTAMQAPFVIAVCDSDPGCAYTQAAREQFGALTPLHVWRTPAQAIDAVFAGTASVAVLPIPSDAEGWWTALLFPDRAGLHVVGRLPFWTGRPEGAPRVQALVVAAIPPDPSGRDRSLIGVESNGAILGAMIEDAGFDARTIANYSEADAAYHRTLIDVAGFLTDQDPRLARLREGVRRFRVLGAYAVPAGGPDT